MASVDAEYIENTENVPSFAKAVENMGNGGRKYSISWIRGMRNLPYDVQEGLRRLEGLEQTKRRQMSGASMDAFRFQPGWARGNNGKLRTELPDLKVKRNGVLPDGNRYEKSDMDFFHPTGFENLLL